LLQEFKERVSKKRKILLHRTLSDALKHFAVTVSPAEEEEEQAILLKGESLRSVIDRGSRLQILHELVDNLPQPPR
jgi:hypothetical protein